MVKRAAPPSEKDLTSFKPFKQLIQQCPGLERQLVLAWNGDIRAMQNGATEDKLIFPLLLKTSHLEKYGFVICQEHMLQVKALYERFVEKLKLVNHRHTGWYVV